MHLIRTFNIPSRVGDAGGSFACDAHNISVIKRRSRALQTLPHTHIYIHMSEKRSSHNTLLIIAALVENSLRYAADRKFMHNLRGEVYKLRAAALKVFKYPSHVKLKQTRRAN